MFIVYRFLLLSIIITVRFLVNEGSVKNDDDKDSKKEEEGERFFCDYYLARLSLFSGNVNVLVFYATQLRIVVVNLANNFIFW